MMKSFKLNKEKNIGNVIFILEGSRTEFVLLETIFVKLLGYSLEQLKRGTDGFVLKGNNPFSKVIALNFNGNHLYEINDDELDKLFFKMSDELGLKPESLPIYYIYDRDVKSYDLNQVRPYVEKYGHAYDNEDGSQGLLLLSYPAIESFMISCLCKNSFQFEFGTGKDLKQFAGKSQFNQQLIRGETEFLCSIHELESFFHSIGIDNFDIDNFRETNLQVYDAEQNYYKMSKAFRLASLLSIVFFDLGIITENNEI